MYELILASDDTSFLSRVETWDVILWIGIALAIWLGIRASNSVLGGLLRAVFFIGVWTIFIFVPLMFVGSFIGAMADGWVAR